MKASLFVSIITAMFIGVVFTSQYDILYGVTLFCISLLFINNFLFGSFVNYWFKIQKVQKKK